MEPIVINIKTDKQKAFVRMLRIRHIRSQRLLLEYYKNNKEIWKKKK